MKINEYDGSQVLAQMEALRLISQSDVDLSRDIEQLIGLISESIAKSVVGVYSLPRFEDDTFLRSEDFIDLAQMVSMNTKVILSECEALQATAEVVDMLVSGMSDSVKSACYKATESVKTLLAYNQALSSTGRSVTVLPEHLNGDFDIIGGSICGAISNCNDASIEVASVQTNGLVGNMLELSSSTPTTRVLGPSEVLFVDPDDKNSSTGFIVDRLTDTLFEVESYQLSPSDEVVQNENLYPGILARILKYDNNSLKPLDWNNGPLGGSLYLDLTLRGSSSYISAIKIKFADRTDPSGMTIPMPSVERVDVSIDGNEWSPTNYRQEAVVLPSGADLVIHVNSTQASYVKIRFRQNISYSTIIGTAAHWLIDKITGEGRWLSTNEEPAFIVNVDKKTSWFNPSTGTDLQGNMILRKIFGVSASRYSISIREIVGESYQYKPISVAESKTYRFSEPIDRVMIRATEFIPEGCSVNYDISHDEGATWTNIYPIERSGQGSDSIVFSEGSLSNPNIQSATYVQVSEKPKSMKIRLKVNSQNNVSPSIQKVSIEPVFSRE